MSKIAEALVFLARIPRTPIASELIVGYELITHSVDPSDSIGMIALAGMIRDCNGSAGGRKIAFKLAEAPNGTLTLWTLPPEPPTP